MTWGFIFENGGRPFQNKIASYMTPEAALNTYWQTHAKVIHIFEIAGSLSVYADHCLKYGISHLDFFWAQKPLG